MFEFYINEDGSWDSFLNQKQTTNTENKAQKVKPNGISISSRRDTNIFVDEKGVTLFSVNKKRGARCELAHTNWN